MPQPPEKTWLAVAVDFFIGALVSDGVVLLDFCEAVRSEQVVARYSLWIMLISGALIGGALAALFRSQFYERYETYHVIPPVEENISRKAQTVLWVVFGAGCLFLVLLLIVSAKR